MRSSTQSKSNKYPYFYRAIVVDNVDLTDVGSKTGRVKLVVPEVLGDILTDWASPIGFAFGGSADHGAITIPEIGDHVYAAFEAGDANRPLYIGGWYKAGELPPELTGSVSTIHSSPKGTDAFADSMGYVFAEPSIKYSSEYPKNKVIKTKSGHIIELDDTEDAERVNIYHKAGTSIEIQPDGSIITRAAADKYDVCETNVFTHTKGEKRERVDGTHNLKVGSLCNIDGGKICLQSNTTGASGTEYVAMVWIDAEQGSVIIESPARMELRAGSRISIKSPNVMINEHAFTGNS